MVRHLGLFCGNAMPLARTLVLRVKEKASNRSASLYSRTLIVTRGYVDHRPQGQGRKDEFFAWYRPLQRGELACDLVLG